MITLSSPRLFLAKPNKEIIAELSESYNINYNPKLGNIAELSFSIPTEIESQHKLIRNPHLDQIKYKYLIKFQDENITEWFLINNPKPEAKEVDTLQVECFSLPFELNDKLVREYKTVNDEGIEAPKNLLQIATELLTNSSWKTLWTTNINVIDADFLTKYRIVEIPSATVLDAIFTVAQKFGALVIFDTENRIVKFDKPQDVGIYRGLNFDLGKYLTGLNQSLDTSSFCSQLKIYGKDGLTINSVNITGSNYLSDYSFFIYPFEKNASGDIISSSDYLTDDLCEALLIYNQLLEDNESVYSNLLSELETYQSEMATLNNQLIVLLEELDVILDSLDIAQKNGDNTTSLLIQKNNKETEINNHKNNLITPKQTQINNVNNQIVDLGNLLSTENNFSELQIEELIKFTATKEITNEYITNPKELLEWGKEEFVKINTPSILLELDIINFNKYLDEDCQIDKGKLNIGDIVRARYDKFNINLSAKIIELNFNYEDSSNVSVVISNLENINKDFDLFLQKLNKTISTSTSVDINKSKWNLAENANNEVQKLLTEEFNASLHQIRAGAGECVDIGKRGITLTDVDNPLEAIRLMHSVIGCTEDGFNSLGVAISARGVHAEKVIGTLLIGQNLIIDASNTQGQKIMTVNETGVTLDGLSLEITGGLPLSQIDAEGIVLENTSYNNVIISTESGLVATRNDNKFRSKINGIEGLKIQKSTDGGTNWSDLISADTNGDLIIKGKLDAGSIISNSSIQGGSINIGNNFIVNSSGDCTASGIFNGTDFKICGISILDTMHQIIGSNLSDNSVGASKIKVNELYVGSGGIRLDPSAVISWDQVTSKPDVAVKSDIPILPSYIQSTKITQTTIESPNIVGGSITSNTTINVGTDVYIGEKLYLQNTHNYPAIMFDNAGYSRIELDVLANNLLIYGKTATSIGTYNGNTYIHGNVSFPDCGGVVAVFG